MPYSKDFYSLFYGAIDNHVRPGRPRSGKYSRRSQAATIWIATRPAASGFLLPIWSRMFLRSDSANSVKTMG